VVPHPSLLVPLHSVPLPTPSTWLQLQRSVGFDVTAAAGVVRFGLPAASVFPRPELAGDSPEVALPIVY